MRMMAYAVAALAAAGIAIMIYSMPDLPPEVVARHAALEAKSGGARVMDEAGELTLSVPEMHCPVACYPAIKKTLEDTDTVESVELAEQTEEGIIDNPQVIVRYKSGFDVDNAIKLLDDRGFSNSDIVQ